MTDSFIVFFVDFRAPIPEIRDQKSGSLCRSMELEWRVHLVAIFQIPDITGMTLRIMSLGETFLGRIVQCLKRTFFYPG
jgi:hypothetical protein